MSPLSLSLFLMTFLLLNGHDFCVPPSMNFLSLCTIQLMIILILSLQKPLLYLSLCNLPIAICALNCELNVWERSQISKPYMPLWLDVSCFLIHISKFLLMLCTVNLLNSRFLGPGILHELGICNLQVRDTQLLIHEFIKYSSRIIVSLLGNTRNWIQYF